MSEPGPGASLQAETERLGLEPAEQRERYASIFDGAPVAMFLVNPEGRVISVNYATEAAVGQDKQDILGLLGGQVVRCVNAFLGDGCGRGEACKTCVVRTSVEETFQTGRGVYKREGRLSVHAGEDLASHHFLVTTSRVDGALGPEVLVALDDITERKSAEANLRRLKDELELEVAERTAELSDANERLEAKLARRQQVSSVFEQRAHLLEYAATHNLDLLLTALVSR